MESDSIVNLDLTGRQLNVITAALAARRERLTEVARETGDPNGWIFEARMECEGVFDALLAAAIEASEAQA